MRELHEVMKIQDMENFEVQRKMWSLIISYSNNQFQIGDYGSIEQLFFYFIKNEIKKKFCIKTDNSNNMQ